MALRMKTKWHRSKRSQRNIEGSRREKTVTDLAGIISFNIWKLAKEIYVNMEKEEFHLGADTQVIAIITEIIAFMIQVSDRMVYGKFSEDQRQEFVTSLATSLIESIDGNTQDLLGEGDYRQGIIDTLNDRFAEYAECADDESGSSYESRRLLGKKISDIMASTDNRWVVEHIMDIELPKSLKTLQRMVTDVLGLPRTTGDG